MFLYVKTFSKCNTCNDREPDVPVSSGRGGGGIGVEKWFVGKIGRKRSRGTSPDYVLRIRQRIAGITIEKIARNGRQWLGWHLLNAHMSLVLTRLEIVTRLKKKELHVNHGSPFIRSLYMQFTCDLLFLLSLFSLFSFFSFFIYLYCNLYVKTGIYKCYM